MKNIDEQEVKSILKKMVKSYNALDKYSKIKEEIIARKEFVSLEKTLNKLNYESIDKEFTFINDNNIVTVNLLNMVLSNNEKLQELKQDDKFLLEYNYFVNNILNTFCGQIDIIQKYKNYNLKQINLAIGNIQLIINHFNLVDIENLNISHQTIVEVMENIDKAKECLYDISAVLKSNQEFIDKCLIMIDGSNINSNNKKKILNTEAYKKYCDKNSIINTFRSE